MRFFKNIALSAMLTIGAFSAVTYTACTKDECEDVVCNNGGTCVSGACSCPTGYEGNQCETEIRTSYDKRYRGNGTDSDGGTYTNWALDFSPNNLGGTSMNMNILDNNNANVLAFTVTLTSNTTFSVDAKTNGNFSYTGTGSITTQTSSLTLNEVNNTSGTTNTTIFNFINMNAE